MKLNLINKSENTNEAQQTNKEISTETKAAEVGVLQRTRMSSTELTLLQNQKALDMTLTDIQNMYSTKLQDLLNSNAALLNQVQALTMQLNGIQIRLAKLSNGASTTEG